MDPGPCRWEGSCFVFRFFSLFRVCILLRKTRQHRLHVDGIKFFPSSPYTSGASRVIGGCVKVYIPTDLMGFNRLCLRWICVDPVFVRLHSRVYRLDSLDLAIFSSTVVANLVLQQGLPYSGTREGGGMTTMRLWITPVFVVVARWPTCMDDFFYFSCSLYFHNVCWIY